MELFEDLSLDLSHTQTRMVRKLKLRSILILEIIKGQWHQISEIKNVIITSWYLILLEQQGKRPAYTLQSKHFTFCSCTWTFCSKHLIPWNLEGFYIFASNSEGNRLQLPFFQVQLGQVQLSSAIVFCRVSENYGKTIGKECRDLQIIRWNISWLTSDLNWWKQRFKFTLLYPTLSR